MVQLNSGPQIKKKVPTYNLVQPIKQLFYSVTSILPRTPTDVEYINGGTAWLIRNKGHRDARGGEQVTSNVFIWLKYTPKANKMEF